MRGEPTQRQTERSRLIITPEDAPLMGRSLSCGAKRADDCLQYNWTNESITSIANYNIHN